MNVLPARQNHVFLALYHTEITRLVQPASIEIQ